MPQTATLLLITNSAALGETMAAYFRDEGYRIVQTAESMGGLRLLRATRPNLIIVDTALSADGAVMLCAMLRKETSAPLILLISGTDEFEQIIGLDMGADLCMVKPISLPEMRARIRALLRRSIGAAVCQPQSFTVGWLRLDVNRRRAWAGEQELCLTPREFDLLIYFMRNRGLVLPREQLIKAVWGEKVSNHSRTLDVHIRWLRQKVEPDPAQPTYIQTVRQIGYRFDAR